MSTLLDCIPLGIQVPDEECPILLNAEKNDSLIKVALENLQQQTGNCPACIMAAFRQRGIPIPMVTEATGWLFKKRMEEIWADINESNAEPLRVW